MITDNTNGQTIVNLQEINVHNIWKNEATNFTPWLAKNISLLSATIGIDLEVIEVEKSVGAFHADIYAQDRNGNGVVIENQLEKTDHDHFGKLLTYAAGLKCKTMIWIATKARPEHKMAVNIQNENNTDTKFYLLELVAHRIGNEEDMNVVVDFKIVCEPNNVPIIDKHTKFWSGIISKDDSLINRIPRSYQYIEIPEIKGAPWSYVVRSKTARVMFYIFDNKELYDSLLIHKEDIEIEFGEALIWTKNEDQKLTTIHTESNIGGVNDEDKWDEIQCDMVERMARLRNAIGKYIE